MQKWHGKPPLEFAGESRLLDVDKRDRRYQGALKHAFVAKLYASFQDDNSLYALTEYCEGGDFCMYLRREEKLPLAVARFYAAQITLAFEHMHEHLVVYRRLEPEGVLLDISGNLKLYDFSASKRLDGVDGKTRTLQGKPEYVPPECLVGKGSHSFGYDWYTLGIFLFELCHGYPPYLADKPMAVYQKTLTATFDFGDHLSDQDNLKSFVEALLVPSDRRLGRFDGSKEIKSAALFTKGLHRTFRGSKRINWTKLARLRVKHPSNFRDGDDWCCCCDCSCFRRAQKTSTVLPVSPPLDLWANYVPYYYDYTARHNHPDSRSMLHEPTNEGNSGVPADRRGDWKGFY